MLIQSSSCAEYRRKKRPLRAHRARTGLVKRVMMERGGECKGLHDGEAGGLTTTAAKHRLDAGVCLLGIEMQRWDVTYCVWMPIAKRIRARSPESSGGVSRTLGEEIGRAHV